MKKLIRLTEQDLHRIVRESVMKVITEEESYVDRMVRRAWERFNNSRLRPIFDALNLKKGEYSIGGDYSYQSLKLLKHDIEIREYNNGRIFVHFGYDGNAGAWGGYTRKCEVKDPSIFSNPRWMSIIKRGGTETAPDVIMKQ